ncbi:MAG: hypothetical protein ACXADF_00885, partial [Candidatus Thorarchaeota archaeon]
MFQIVSSAIDLRNCYQKEKGCSPGKSQTTDLVLPSACNNYDEYNHDECTDTNSCQEHWIDW